MKIGFIGVGKLGMPCAEAIASKGYSVSGYDVAKVSSNTIEIVSNIRQLVSNKDIVFVAVPTPHDPSYDGKAPTAHLEPKDFDYSIVRQVLTEANKHMTKDQLLVLISTVLPGTVRREFISLVPNTRFVYNPYLIAMGSVAWDMINPEMVMIGTEDGSETGDARLLVDFYKNIMENNPRYEIGTWDECEAMKIFYNTFISAKIGIVNMIQDVAEKQGNINVDKVTNALANSSMRIMGPKYMTAGMGDGGGCHPRDNIALRHMSDRLGLGYDLFGTIMQSREQQAENLARTLVKHAEHTGYPIVIHGKSYKPEVHFLDGSYSLLVGHYVKEFGYQVNYVDPLTNDYYQSNNPSIFLLAHSSKITYGTENYNLYCEIPAQSVVIDPWRTYINDQCTVIHYGNTRFFR